MPRAEANADSVMAARSDTDGSWKSAAARARRVAAERERVAGAPRAVSNADGYTSMIHRREISLLIVIVALGLVLAAMTPGYFARENLSDLLLGNMPVLIVAIGTTLVILTGDIDISVGSMFAICGVAAGIAAKATGSVAARRVGRVRRRRDRSGALNGSLVAYLRLPSIVVTLATMVALRDGLRWATQGAWVQDLPPGFQWFGLPQSAYPFVACAIVVALLGAMTWVTTNVAAGPRGVCDRIE